jgi:hypothetical protein
MVVVEVEVAVCRGKRILSRRGLLGIISEPSSSSLAYLDDYGTALRWLTCFGAKAGVDFSQSQAAALWKLNKASLLGWASKLPSLSGRLSATQSALY